MRKHWEIDNTHRGADVEPNCTPDAKESAEASASFLLCRWAAGNAAEAAELALELAAQCDSTF